MAERSRVVSSGENAYFSLSALGALIFPHSRMNHKHESWKTLVCHLL